MSWMICTFVDFLSLISHMQTARAQPNWVALSPVYTIMLKREPQHHRGIVDICVYDYGEQLRFFCHGGGDAQFIFDDIRAQ